MTPLKMFAMCAAVVCAETMQSSAQTQVHAVNMSVKCTGGSCKANQGIDKTVGTFNTRRAIVCRKGTHCCFILNWHYTI